MNEYMSEWLKEWFISSYVVKELDSLFMEFIW